MKNYVVKQRDTLWKIAREFGVTVEQIARANGLRGKQIHLIRKDQILRIPIEGPADTIIDLNFKGLDYRSFTPRLVRIEHDGITTECAPNIDGTLTLCINDHSQGLKVWIEDPTQQFVPTLDYSILPLGNWELSIESRKISTSGSLKEKSGREISQKEDVKAATTHNSQQRNGTTALTQTRVENGRPIHGLATIYIAENLRLLPGNEKYRRHIVAAAEKTGHSPQSLAALIDAEAAKREGVWIERSNEASPSLAQGLAQFFEPAWLDVFKDENSAIHQDCQRISRNNLLRKRLEAKYAIDAAAVYASMNLKSFEKLSGLKVTTLPPDEKAKIAYILHHDGVGGGLRLIGKGKTWEPEAAEKLLYSQLRDKEKVDALITQYGDDPRKAYKGWLYAYTDGKINVNSFLVQDKLEFASRPRSTADIFSGLSKEAATVKPAPKPKTEPKAKNPSATPPRTPATSTTSSGSSDGGWRNPLDKCALRTKGLASVNSSKFGMTRNGGTRPHQGIDLIAEPGTPVYAVADGTVRLARAPSPGYAYGHTMILEVNIDDLPERQAAVARQVNPGRRTIGFFYAHLSEFCTRGGVVSAGTMIAKSGCSGNASNMKTIETGAHLHFEVRLDPHSAVRGLANRTDPLNFINM